MTGVAVCPWCGLIAIPDVPTHIAMTEGCAHEQMMAVLWPESGPVEET